MMQRFPLFLSICFFVLLFLPLFSSSGFLTIILCLSSIAPCLFSFHYFSLPAFLLISLFLWPCVSLPSFSLSFPPLFFLLFSSLKFLLSSQFDTGTSGNCLSIPVRQHLDRWAPLHSSLFASETAGWSRFCSSVRCCLTGAVSVFLNRIEASPTKPAQWSSLWSECHKKTKMNRLCSGFAHRSGSVWRVHAGSCVPPESKLTSIIEIWSVYFSDRNRRDIVQHRPFVFDVSAPLLSHSASIALFLHLDVMHHSQIQRVVTVLNRSKLEMLRLTWALNQQAWQSPTLRRVWLTLVDVGLVLVTARTFRFQ